MIAFNEFFSAIFVYDDNTITRYFLDAASASECYASFGHAFLKGYLIHHYDVSCNIILHLNDGCFASKGGHCLKRKVAARHAAAAYDKISARNELRLKVRVDNTEDI